MTMLSHFAAAGGAVPVYIEDVFSTYLYTGNGSTQTINNGIDLAGKGGLVWIKSRSGANDHNLYDTARGSTSMLGSNFTNAAETTSDFNSFNTNGFTLNTPTTTNNLNRLDFTQVSWTFRKQPKFFDVVTWTGSGANRTIAHNLGSVPGCIIVKRTDVAADWQVYHRSLANTEYTVLNTTAAKATGATRWNSTTPTDTVFSLGTDATVNASGGTYVAYLFAHNAGGFGLTGTDNVISCGSYTGNGSTAGPVVSLGHEPQWLMIKNASGYINNWQIIDNMRGMYVGSNDALLQANLSNAESTSYDAVNPTSTGFQLTVTGSDFNASGATYIYIAIRRGPMKVPTTGTSVFYPQAISQADSIDSTGVPFPPDLVNTFSRNGTDRASTYNSFLFLDRLRGIGVPNNTYTLGGAGLVSSSTAVEISGSTFVQLKADSQNITRASGWNAASYGNWIYYFMRRAPGFMDVVCYTGTGVARTVAHNLGVAPELMIVKQRNTANDWPVYAAPSGNNKVLYLNFPDAQVTRSEWNLTTPTASVFSLNTSAAVNASGSTYVAYLFATCPGVSKVGSYTGTGATQQINCGFTSGARFVLIKATSTTGGWLVWDSSRGIVAGNDPYLALNSTAAEVTTTDWVDTAASGFELSNAAGNLANSSGVSYIFLAIA